VTTYELIFETDPIEEHLQDKIDEYFDDALMSMQGKSFFVTVSADGLSGAESALRAASLLEKLGVRVRRLAEDLVTRKDIAARTNNSPQAVGQWVRGERHADVPFPEPYNYVAGGVWLWAEIHDWLTRISAPVDDVSYPSRRDYALVNHVLDNSGHQWGTAIAHVAWAAHREYSKSASFEAALAEHDKPYTRTAIQASRSVPVIHESWTTFALAA